jgi:hypothetical protein
MWRSKRASLAVAVFTAIAGVLLAANQAQANLIVNGGFETGDFTGWTVDPDPSFPQYIVTSPVESGTYAAQIAGYSDQGTGPDTLSQTVGDTAGQSYYLSFGRYIDGNGGPTVSLTVTWNGNQIFSELNPGTFGFYQDFSFVVVGTGSDTLLFTSANDPSYTYLDDVSLTATPLPSTWTMLIAGFLGIGFFAYRGGKKNTSALAAA